MENFAQKFQNKEEKYCIFSLKPFFCCKPFLGGATVKISKKLMMLSI